MYKKIDWKTQIILLPASTQTGQGNLIIYTYQMSEYLQKKRQDIKDKQ